jgi:hypothetical protein
VHLLVNELYEYQNARCKVKNCHFLLKKHFISELWMNVNVKGIGEEFFNTVMGNMNCGIRAVILICSLQGKNL